MPLNAADRFRGWCAREEDAKALHFFRRAFALLWLVYDLLDLACGGTAAGGFVWPVDHGLPALQLALIAAQLLLAFDVRPALLCFACFVFRALESWLYLSLNDFYYYAVTMLILSQVEARPGGRTLAWPRDLLLLQAGWIYFATALLKLNPEWLSGGHLYVRLQYLALVFDWPFPAFVRDWTASLSHDALLAYAGVAMEFLLAVLLFTKAPRRILLPVSIALHLFAALFVNVWFFGFAMVLQVALARSEPWRKRAEAES